MKSASSVKGINRIAEVVVVIIIMLIGGWMSRQLLELQKAAERVSSMNTNQIVVFTYDAALNPFMYLGNATALGIVAGILFLFFS
jgi:hypothetical protein